MKVEKINDNKAKITLTFDELKKKKITLNEIKCDKIKAQDFFLELLEDTNLIDEFETDANELFIEASKENNLFTITVTKITDNILSHEYVSSNTIYKISSNIYVFNNIKHILNFAKKAIAENLYIPNCELYYFNNKLFLAFKKKDIKSPLFVKTFSLLSEYSEHYYSSTHLNDILVEHGTLIFNNNLTQILEYPYFLT